MQVKTYTGKSPAETLTRIKAELGNDVVILSKKSIEEEGCKLCEIMVGLEPQTNGSGNGSGPLTQALAGVGGRRDRVSISRAAAQRKSAAAGNNGNGRVTRDDFLAEALDGSTRFSREWRQIKHHFMTLLMRSPRWTWSACPPGSGWPWSTWSGKACAEIGLAPGLSQACVTNPEQTVLPVLEEAGQGPALRPAHLAPEIPRPGRSRGRGQDHLHPAHGPGRQARKSQDPRLPRINADRLREFGPSRPLLPLRRAVGPGLPRGGRGRRLPRPLFKEARDAFDLILVDLPALAKGESLTDWMERMGLDRSRATTQALHLVLSPHYAPAQLEAFLDQYPPAVERPAWSGRSSTKPVSLENMVNTAHASGLPVSALSYGPGLTDGLVAAEPEAIWRLLFKHQLPGPGKTAKETHA